MYSGKNIILRRVRPSDLDEIMKYVNDYDVYSSFTDSVPLPKSEEYQLRWIENSVNKKIITFAIEEKNTGEFLGTCQLRGIDTVNAKAILSIIIGKSGAQGKGYGRDSVNTLLDFAFNELNLHKVSLYVYEDNIAAIKLYEKCGFKSEGRLKNEIYRRGGYCDQLAFSILRNEYLKEAERNE